MFKNWHPMLKSFAATVLAIICAVIMVLMIAFLGGYLLIVAGFVLMWVMVHGIMVEKESSNKKA